MGYEVRMYVGEVYQYDPEKPVECTGGEIKTYWSNGEEKSYNTDGHCQCAEHRGLYMSVISMIELRKIGDGALYFTYSSGEVESTPVHFYGEHGGNEEVTEDCYGSRMKGFAIEDVIYALEREQEEDNYRRFHIALQTLKAIQETFDSDMEKQRLMVAFYGH